MILFILGIIVLFMGIFLIIKAHNIQETKDIRNQETFLTNQKHLEELRNDLYKCAEEREKQLNQIALFEDEYERKKEKLNKNLEMFKNYTKLEGDKFEQEIKDNIKEIQNQKNEAEIKLNEVTFELNKIKESISAGVQAQLREREKQEKFDFYKITIAEADLTDIEKINQIKSILSKPVILSKLIWTSYYQKQTTDMCNRILGTDIKCGIYKITNLITQQAYVGQSVNIADRWKEHIKCGLGIEASATNKLYNAMQKDGVHNFTFELIEECPRAQLNEKERQWIEIYQTDKYGYNLTKGNK